jgi:cobalt-zinc-cadmium efflux system membrane fusion protein
MLLLGVSFVVAAVVSGCAKSGDPTGAAPQSAADAAVPLDDHTGWWCVEHGVPEEVCGQCNAKLAAEFQRKGDWCKEHDRPDSQCFACHPEHEARFAAQYEAKLGKKPPKPEG